MACRWQNVVGIRGNRAFVRRGDRLSAAAFVPARAWKRAGMVKINVDTYTY
jgi:hypothetical protein